jgi:hypothetical protein
MMLNWISHYHLLMAAIVATAMISAWKGAWPERIGAIANLANAVAILSFQLILAPGGLAIASLTADGLLAVTFLGLTLRFATLWLGAAMLLQAAQFSLHAYFYVTERPIDLLFRIVNNVVSWGVIWAILIGVAGSWRRTNAASRLVA